MRISLDEAKKVILVAMYEYIYDNPDSEYVELPAIRGACRTNLSLAFVSRVVAVLVSEQRLRTLTSGVHTYYTLTQKGWVDAESSEGLEELLSGLGAEVVPRAGEVPASDRVVTLNHNSDEYREVKVGLDELAEKLRQSNDIGELSAEEATVALKEVEDLSADLDRSKLRVGAFGLRARNSLQWIGSKAGESVIGQLATAQMALILAYIGTLF